MDKTVLATDTKSLVRQPCLTLRIQDASSASGPSTGPVEILGAVAEFKQVREFLRVPTTVWTALSCFHFEQWNGTKDNHMLHPDFQRFCLHAMAIMPPLNPAREIA